jgi:hypothetical protein
VSGRCRPDSANRRLLPEIETNPPEVEVWPSVDSIAPEEQGGPVARQGFSYQDEIAVGFLLDMIEDARLAKIHFESHDDLVLIWSPLVGAQLTAEFVQVKAEAPDKLWSVADICQRKKKDAVGTSIFEISLGRDRHEEVSNFRMVTLRPIVSDLAPLTYVFGQEGRKSDCEGMVALKADLDGRFPGLKSKKKNDCGYWLENCRWDVRHDIKTVRKANTLRVFELAQAAGQSLLLEQINVLLDEIRAWVKAAGDAKWIPDKAKKIVRRADALEWWTARLLKLAQIDAPSGGALAEKMKLANLPSALVAMAVDLRRGYAAKVRTATYMPPEEADDLQERVKSTAQSLSANLAAGTLDLDGPQFHALCLKEMDALNAARPSGAKDQAAFLKGCLYDIADRCLLRFDRSAL